MLAVWWRFWTGRRRAIDADFASGQHTTARSDDIVATKVGRSSDLYPDNYDFDAIHQHVVASAERLQTDKIDLIQLHCVPPSELERGEIFESMNRLVSEGLIAHWGASVETLAEAKRCLEQENLASLQIIFNLFRQDAAWELFDAASAAKVGIIVRLPLASGMLTGKFGQGHQFAPTDHRNYNADGAHFSVGETFSGIEFSIGLGLVEQLQNIVGAETSLADLSLRWILDFPAVTSVIAGCSRPEQAVANANVSQQPPLSPELHEKLKEFYLGEVKQHIRCPI